MNRYDIVMDSVIQEWLACITDEFEIEDLFINNLRMTFLPIPVLTHKTIEDRIMEYITKMYDVGDDNLSVMRQITHRWLVSRLPLSDDDDDEDDDDDSASARSRSRSRSVKGLLRSLPKHLVDSLWLTSTEWKCGVCLDQIKSMDKLIIIVCCGKAYCKRCFAKIDRCGYCRAQIF